MKNTRTLSLYPFGPLKTSPLSSGMRPFASSGSLVPSNGRISFSSREFASGLDGLSILGQSFWFLASNGSPTRGVGSYD